MKKHIVILTENYHIIDLFRFNSDEDAEQAYQKNKRNGYSVIKATIEKAHELNIINI